MKRFLLLVVALLFSSLAWAAVNINTATKDELDVLPGIGPVKAQAIIDHRNANGPFKTPEDIMKVKGIKEGEFGKLKGQISVSGASSAPAAAVAPAKAASPATTPAAPAAPAKAAAPMSAPSAPAAAPATAPPAPAAPATAHPTLPATLAPAAHPTAAPIMGAPATAAADSIAHAILACRKSIPRAKMMRNGAGP